MYILRCDVSIFFLTDKPLSLLAEDQTRYVSSCHFLLAKTNNIYMLLFFVVTGSKVKVIKEPKLFSDYLKYLFV